MKTKKMNESLKENFTALNEKNREKAVELTKFLIMAQNTIVPKMLNPEKRKNST